MYMKRRLVSCLTALFLIFTLIPTTAFAASPGDTIKVEGENVTANPGDEIVVNIMLTENPGMNLMKLAFEWDATALEMTYAGIEDEDDQKGFLPEKMGMNVEYDEHGDPVVWGVPKDETGTIYRGAVLLGDETLKKKGKFAQFTETGRIYSLYFTVKSTAKNGEYPITIDNGGQNPIFNDNTGHSAGNNLVLVTTNGKVTVEGSTSHEHNFVWVEKAANCTEGGIKGHYECECGQWAKDAMGNILIDEADKASYTVGALGHSFVLDTSKYEDGYEWNANYTSCTAHGKCERDGCTETAAAIGSITGGTVTCTQGATLTATFTEAWAPQTTKEVPADPDAHKELKHAEAVAVDCEKDGNIEYWYCEECGKYYSDAAGSTEITDKSSVVIGQTGHNYQLSEIKWSADHTSCWAVLVCQNNPAHTDEVYATVEDQSTGAECGKPGQTKFVATFPTETGIAQQTYTEDVDALEHNWVDVSYSWNSDNSSCTAYHKCDRCKTEETEEATEANGKLVIETKAATCDEAGSITYTASFTTKGFETKTKTVAGEDKKGHKWNISYAFDDEAKTCTGTAICENDAAHKVTETVSYTVNVIEAPKCGVAGSGEKVATFTLDPLTNYSEPVVIDALEHEYSEPYSYVWTGEGDEITCTASRRCKHCDLIDFEIATIANGKITAETKDPTCTEAGKTVYTATFTKEGFETKTNEVPGAAALKHDWTINYTWDETAGTCKAEAVCKRNNTHKVEETVSYITNTTTEPKCEVPGAATLVAQFTKDPFTTQEKPAVLDALEHEWGDPVYAWTITPDSAKCVASRYCPKCGTTATEEANLENGKVQAVVTPASCEAAGKTVYTADFEADEFGTSTKEIAGDPAKGHQWVVGDYVWAEDNSTCTGNAKCSVCEKDLAVTVNTSVEEKEDDTGLYTAEFDEEPFTTQTKTAVLEISYTASDAVWTKGSTDGALIVVNRNINDNKTFGEFESVTVNGEALDAANYTTEEGSLKLTIAAAFLEALEEGDYNVIVNFTKGEAKAKLTVVPAAAPIDDDPGEGKDNPSEGDDKDQPSEGEDKPSEGGDKPSDGGSSPNTGAASAAGAIAIVVAAAAIVMKKKK